jgi:hypothetical protein
MLQRFVRSAAVLDRRRAVVVQAIGDGGVIAAGEEALDARQELRADRKDVGEGSMPRTRLLDDDPSVALEDVRLDLAPVIVDERVDVDFTGENALARLAHARRAQRVGGARPPESR